MKKSVIKRQTDTIDKLEDTLLNLLINKDIKDIKVRELCLLANVNHQTFYNYYYDQLDLYEDIEKKGIDEILDILRLGFKANLNSDQSDYINKIKDTKYFKRLFKQKSSASFKEKIIESSYYTLEKELTFMTRINDRRYVTIYILNGSISILEEWIKNDCLDDSKGIASLIYKIAGCIDLYHK